MKPPHHVHKAAHQPYRCPTEGQQLRALVQIVAAISDLAPDVGEVMPGHPETPRHEDDHRPEADPACNRVPRTHQISRRTEREAETVAQPDLKPPQQEEHPYAEENPRVHEERKTHCIRVDLRVDRRELPQQVQPSGVHEADARKSVNEIADDVPQDDAQRDRRTRPEDTRAQHRR